MVISGAGLGIVKSVPQTNPALMPLTIPSLIILIKTGKNSVKISINILDASHLALSLGDWALSKQDELSKSNKKGNKLLPWQYYNEFNYISIPMVGKQTLIPGWQNKKETVVPHYLGSNIGLLTGKINNLTILDIDIKDDGMLYWNKIKKEYPYFIAYYLLHLQRSRDYQIKI